MNEIKLRQQWVYANCILVGLLLQNMMSTEVEQYFRTVGLDPIPRGNTVYMLKGEVGYSSAVQNHWVIPTFKTSF